MYPPPGSEVRSGQTECISDSIELQAYLGEYSVKTAPGEAICTDSKIRYEHPDGNEEVIQIDEIDHIVLDESDALEGFDRLSYVLGGFAVLFTLMAIPFLLSGIVFDPIAGGVYLSAALCWYGAADFYRFDGTTLDVLEIHTAAGRTEFVSDEGNTVTLADAIRRAKTEGEPTVSEAGGRTVVTW